MPIMRHPLYFFPDGDIIIKVEETMFRVHRYFLTRESKHFRTMFLATIPCRDPPGLSETNPVVFKDATSEGFEDLLWVFYNPDYSIYTASLEKWKRILTLAQQWGFIHVEKLCVRELENLTILPVEKIQLYQDFMIDQNLLHDSYIALTVRAEPLDVDEGNKLGLSTSLKIARARELARAQAPDGSTDFFGTAIAQLQDSAVQSVIRNVFGLQEPAAAQSTPPALQPSAGKQQPTNDDLVDKASAKSRKNNNKT